jgi:hypothetical protein
VHSPFETSLLLLPADTLADLKATRIGQECRLSAARLLLHNQYQTRSKNGFL